MKYRIVPIPATKEMRTAGGWACADERGNPDPGSAEYVYDAVLSASPNPLDDEELVKWLSGELSRCNVDLVRDGYDGLARAVLTLLDGR